jgi:ABC-type transport system involved in multi-copper enzyme maturation permease subunit
MQQFVTIAVNTFMELVRQPVFLLLMTASAVFSVFLACVPYFGFGDDPRLVKSSVLAVMLLAGLLGAVLSASSSLAREIRTGTALAVLAKPVGRAPFLLAKFAGLAGVLAVLTYVNMVAALSASRMAFDAYGDADMRGLLIWALFLLLAYVAGGFSNYFLRRPFTSDAVFALVVCVSLAFVVTSSLTRPDPTNRSQMIEAFARVDWRLIPASVLILLALWVLAGLALACATRLDLIPTLVICSGFFVLGLMSEFLLGKPARAGSWWASMLFPVLPNWQIFWIADALGEENVVPWARYLGGSLGYTVCYVGATLAAALYLFEERELS